MRLGKNKQTVSLTVVLLLTVSAWGQTDKSHKYRLGDTLQKVYAISGNQSITINYALPELDIANINIADSTYFRLSAPGHIHTVAPGKPELPVFSRLISIPEGSDYRIKITGIKTRSIKPSGDKIGGILYPAQEEGTKNTQQGNHGFVLDRRLYNHKGLISSDTVRIEKIGKVRNSTLSTLYIYPVRYDPRKNRLDIITSMKVEIIFTSPDISVARSLSSESIPFAQSLSEGVLNFNKAEVIPGFSNKPLKMIIITDSIFKKQLKPFIKWKIQKGFRVTVLYKGKGLAGNTYTELKDTLTKIYNNSTTDDPPPEYLLIIGDVNHVPYYGAGGTGNVTDMYYGEFTGNGDYIPEMYIGRLPVADTSELNTVVKKIIQYEKADFAVNNNFYSKALVFTGYDAEHADYMNGQVKYAITNYLTQANSIHENHFYYPQSYTEKDSIIDLINRGTSFINYTGHGDASGWLHINNGLPDTPTGILVDDLPLLTNKYMYPFIISNACRTAQFNIKASFGNSMVLSRNKGAIGFIGCSNDSYWDEDYFWSLGPGSITADPHYEETGLGAYDRLFHTHGESPSDWYFTMGQINYAGNLAVSASNTVRKKYYWETYNLIGDPSVIPITGTPHIFNITLPDTLPNGLTSVTLDVDPFSYAAFTHSDTLCDAKFASATGSVTLQLPSLEDDSVLFVLTGQNKRPLIKTIQISDVKEEFLNLNSTGINDINGNNNKAADYGENIFLSVKISNLGSTDAHNVYGKISTTSGLISINNDSVYIGTLASKSEIELSDKLEITIAGNVPDLEVIPVTLTLTDLKTEKQYTIDITVHAPKLQIINYIIDDSSMGNGNNVADPGETLSLIFRVRNFGTSDINGDLSVISTNENMTVVEPSVKSGVLQFGDITEIPVIVKISDKSATGSYIYLTSTLDCTPYLISKNFTFRVGRIRESFETASFSVFPWINISTVPWIITEGGSLDGSFAARSGPIDHNGSTSLVIRTVYPEPDSLRFYYKVSSELNYDFLSFSLNGTEVFKKSGDVPWTKKVIAVPAGVNNFEWKYYKDNTQSSGSDCAWVDMIDFAGEGSVKYVKTDLEVARIVTPIQKERFGYETVTAKVLNRGAEVLNGFNLAYSVNGQYAPVTEHFEENILPYSDSVSVSFKSKLNLSKYGLYDIKIYGTDNNDDYVSNDTLYVNLENTSIIENLSLYPNPFHDHFSIFVNAPYADRIHISITNVNGVKVYDVERDIISGDNIIEISDVKLVPSLYYLNIRGATINKTVPVIRIGR